MMLATSRVGDLRRAAVGAARRLSSSAAPTPSPAFDQGHYNVIAACYVGAALWIYRDSLEADGVTVTVPKAKLDKLQAELAAIKKLLGQ